MRRKHRVPPAVGSGLAIAAMVMAATAPASAATANPFNGINPNTLANKTPVGQGPASYDMTKAYPPSSVNLTPAQIAEAKAKHYTIGIAMQTMTLDWSQLQVRGITDTIKKYGGKVIGVTDANFDVPTQISDVQDLIAKKPDAIISIPVSDAGLTPTYAKIEQSGIKLTVIMNPPNGLKYNSQYTTVVSPDDVGDGYIAARELSHLIPKHGTLGVIAYGVDFFTTNQRDKGMKEWFKAHRPDVHLIEADFTNTSDASIESLASSFLTAHPNVNAIYGAWSAPGEDIAAAERSQGLNIPIVTYDVDNPDAVELASGGLIKAVSAQDAYGEGVAEANATVRALEGYKNPPWIVVPGFPVLPSNVIPAYKYLFRTNTVPSALVSACKSTGFCTDNSWKP